MGKCVEMSQIWDCPLDIVAGDSIEIDNQPYGVLEGKVEDILDGVISVTMGDYHRVVYSIDPRYTKWRRVLPKVTYGARCADKHCNEWYPDAEYTPNFKCWRCKNRA